MPKRINPRRKPATQADVQRAKDTATAESAEDMRQQAYTSGLRDGQAEARHDYCNGCGKQEFYDACNGHYRLIWTLLSLDSADREIVRTVVERLAAAREEENA